MTNNINNSQLSDYVVTTDNNIAYTINKKENLAFIDCKTPIAKNFIAVWTPILKSGRDILHLSMSSAVSSAYEIANTTALYMKTLYPDRKVIVFDTLAISLGECFQVLDALKLRDNALPLKDLIKALLEKRGKQVQLFSLDSKHLLKPILKGNYCGEIVVNKHANGRIRALKALVSEFTKNRDKASNDPVGIAYDGNPKAANFLLKLLKKAAPDAEFFTISEPGTFCPGRNSIALVYTCA